LFVSDVVLPEGQCAKPSATIGRRWTPPHRVRRHQCDPRHVRHVLSVEQPWGVGRGSAPASHIIPPPAPRAPTAVTARHAQPRLPQRRAVAALPHACDGARSRSCC